MENLFESAKRDITRLVIIRHGRTQANKEGRIGCWDDIPLDEVGEKQVEKAATYLERLDIEAIYSSPILRTMQTSQIISNHLHLPVNQNEGLKEFNFSIIGNRTMNEIKEENLTLYGKIDKWIESEPNISLVRPEVQGAEKISCFTERIKTFCDFILEKHPGQIIAAVTHMAVIKGFMSVLFGPPASQHMNFNAFNASISIIDFYKKNPVLTAFNNIHHLDMEYTFGRVNLL